MSGLKLSLDNPYGNVTIPRARLRSGEDDSMVIANLTAVYNTQAGAPSALNPYGSFRPQGEQGQPGVQDTSGQNPTQYQARASTYVIKETEEKVNCCYACCCCCRRKK